MSRHETPLYFDLESSLEVINILSVVVRISDYDYVTVHLDSVPKV